MKALICCIGFVVAASTCLFAQEFPVETIFENGDRTNRVNLVFIADGYKSDQLFQFVTDVNTVLNNIFNQSPFKEYKPYFNAYAIKVPSNEAGADHPQNTGDSDCGDVPILSVDNYFGSTFDYAGIHRLLVPTENNKLGSVLADNFPLYDQAFVLVNSSYYGGSGGFYATSSTNISSSEVSIHEIGHSFAGLADEYWIQQFEAPNRTQESNPTKVKWKNWIGKNNIGVIQFTEPGGSGWYRPHPNCKMRSLGVPFCSVCKESFVERIHSLVNPFIDYAPVESEFDLSEGSIDLSLELLKPQTNTLKVVWKRNGVEMKSNKNKDQITVTSASLPLQSNTFEAIIMDTTALTRSDAHIINHVYSVTWTIATSNITGVEVTSTKSEYEIVMYPNPVIDKLNLSYSLPKESQVSVFVSDVNGKRVKKLVNERQHPGKHLYDFNSSELNMNSSGVYFLNLSINGILVTEKLIRH